MNDLLLFKRLIKKSIYLHIICLIKVAVVQPVTSACSFQKEVVEAHSGKASMVGDASKAGRLIQQSEIKQIIFLNMFFTHKH